MPMVSVVVDFEVTEPAGCKEVDDFLAEVTDNKRIREIPETPAADRDRDAVALSR